MARDCVKALLKCPRKRVYARLMWFAPQPGIEFQAEKICSPESI